MPCRAPFPGLSVSPVPVDLPVCILSPGLVCVLLRHAFVVQPSARVAGSLSLLVFSLLSSVSCFLLLLPFSVLFSFFSCQSLVLRLLRFCRLVDSRIVVRYQRPGSTLFILLFRPLLLRRDTGTASLVSPPCSTASSRQSMQR